VGDTAGYIPIDSIVPDIQTFYFLCPKAYEKYEEDGEIKQRQIGSKYEIGSVPEKYRILKAKKIRGIYSQGMLIDLNLYITLAVSHMGKTITDLPDLGESITDLIGLKKWEEEEEDNIPNAKKSRGANQASPPKGWSIPHYDVDGLRKYVICLNDNEEIVLTEKLHGANAAFCHDGEKLWVKSRNFYKKMDEDDPWWDIAIRYDLEKKLSSFPMKVFFGELYGNVKGFRYDCEVIGGAMPAKIKFFDIWDASTMRYMDYDPFLDVLKETGLDPVPELYRGVWQGKDIMYPYAEGPTTVGGKHVREGFVLRTIKERFEPRLKSRMQVKLVGEGYNLQK
jgi:RNA ligase (TIGR02306 family)